MSRNDEERHLQACLGQIEIKLDRGKSGEWTNYDFEKLSEAVNAASGVRLSVTTLKRMFGRLKYESFPTLTTLNALARYVGYDDWRTFIQHQGDVPEAEGHHQSAEPLHKWRLPQKFIGITLAALLVVSGYFLISSQRQNSKPNPADFQFRADKIVAEGVPNSVVFHYDATAAATDSIFIVQTWDISRKKLVSRTGHAHSAMYYYPGFFRTKLIVDGHIVKTHDLQVTSGGWLCLAENETIPVYFKKEECVSGDSVAVSSALMEKYNLPLHPKPPRIRFFHQGDMGELMNDNFIFETKLRNPFSEGSNACQFVQVLIQCKDDIIIIPLAAPACIGDLELWAAGTGVDSKHGDLSKFGCDLNEWVSLRVVTVDRNMKFYIDNREAYSLTFPNEPTGIVGVQYRFYGPGAVKDTRFEGAGTVYEF